MTLSEKIEAAFVHRPMPEKVVDLEGRFQIDSDIDDTLWFQGRSWRSLTREDWRRYYCAVTYFNRDAFLYYLQSLLILTIEEPESFPDVAVDSFMWELDRSPGRENWDPRLTNRYFGLSPAEYDAIKEWLIWASENIPQIFCGLAASGPGDGFGRAFDTIDLMQNETAKLGSESNNPERTE